MFIRDSLSYDNRGPSGALQMTGSIVAKGTRDTIVGYTTVGGVMYYVQLRAYLHRTNDIDLQPGCKLGPYDN